jgi:cAMP phosphodiesterase
VRSTSTNWKASSVVAVDAGVHLSAITRILEKSFPSEASASDDEDSEEEEELTSPLDESAQMAAEPETASAPSREETPVTTTVLENGPFAGYPFPCKVATANAINIVREQVSAYLITHPHLDHVSGFIINTAGYTKAKQKRIAALPFVVDALRTHVFNDILWPNLTDEGGVGFITYQRLTEGGNIALGDGDSRGFLEVCDGLAVKAFKVSHGTCTKGANHVHRGSVANLQEAAVTHQSSLNLHHADDGRQHRSLSFSMPSQPGTPLLPGTQTEAPQGHPQCVVDSTAFFLRTEAPPREILFFGDVEPDSISLSPRNHTVWAAAAPKVAAGILTGIFIECSYNNSQDDSFLFGHLAPRHLIEELVTLSKMVREERIKMDLRDREDSKKSKKRKRASNSWLPTSTSTAAHPHAGSVSKANKHTDDGDLHKEFHQSSTWSPSPRRQSSRVHSSKTPQDPHASDVSMTDYLSNSNTTISTPQTRSSSHPTIVPSPLHNTLSPGENNGTQRLPPSISSAKTFPLDLTSNHALDSSITDGQLKGVRVVVIHVKDPHTDERSVAKSILRQLKRAEKDKKLGCEFLVAERGTALFF